MALRTMQNQSKASLAATTGAVGGSFGLVALPIELPILTIIMLRSIGGRGRVGFGPASRADRIPKVLRKWIDRVEPFHYTASRHL